MTMRNVLRIAAPVFSLALVGCFLYYKTNEVKSQHAGGKVEEPREILGGSKSKIVAGAGAGASGSAPVLLPGSKSDVMIRTSETTPGTGQAAPSTMIFSGSKSGVVVPPQILLPGSKSPGGMLVPQSQTPPPQPEAAPTFLLSGSKSLTPVPSRPPASAPQTKPSTQPSTQPATQPGGTK